MNRSSGGPPAVRWRGSAPAAVEVRAPGRQTRRQRRAPSLIIDAFPAVTVPSSVNTGAQAGEFFETGVLPRAFVERDRVSPWGPDSDTHNLTIESSGRRGIDRPAMTLDRIRILLLAGDAVGAREPFGDLSHREAAQGALQSVRQHRVQPHRFDVIGSVPRYEQRRAAHRLHPAGDDQLRVPRADRLAGEHHGLQSGAADFVDRQRRHPVGQPGFERRLPRRGLPDPGRQHVPHDDFIDAVDGVPPFAQPGPIERTAHGDRPQFRRGDFAESTPELPDRRAAGGENNGIRHGIARAVNRSRGAEGSHSDYTRSPPVSSPLAPRVE